MDGLQPEVTEDEKNRADSTVQFVTDPSAMGAIKFGRFLAARPLIILIRFPFSFK